MTHAKTPSTLNLTPLQYVWLLIILLTACAARFYGLDRLSLWADEIWVVMQSPVGSLWDLLSYVYYHDNHPPGYYLISRFTLFFIGSTDFAIRLPSAVAGVCLVCAIFRVAHKHFSLEAACIAAAVAAGAYQLIYFSQEARANIYVALFALIAFHYFYALLLEGDTSSKSYVAFWLATAMCCYLHYAGLVFVFCLVLVYGGWLLVLKTQANNLSSNALSNKTALWLGVKMFSVPLLLYAPWLPGVYHHLVASPPEGWQHAPNLETLQKTSAYLFGPDSVRQWLSMGVVVVSAIAPGVMLLRNKNALLTPADKNKMLFMAATVAMIVLPVLVFFVKSRISQSAYNHRHFLYAVPLMIILAGSWLSVVIQLLPDRWRKYAVSVVLVCILGYQVIINKSYGLYTGNHFKEDYRAAAGQVADDAGFLQDNQNVIIASSRFFDHYLNIFIHRQSDIIFDSDSNPADVLRFLRQKNAAVEFYYLEAPLNPAKNNMITPQSRLLAEHYQPVCRSRYSRIHVIKFRTAPPVSALPLTEYPPCSSTVNEVMRYTE